MVVMMLVPYYYYYYYNYVIVLSVLFLIIKSCLFAVNSLSLYTAFFRNTLTSCSHTDLCVCVCVYVPFICRFDAY